MKPTYVMIKTECVNHLFRTPCHVILQEVVDGDFANIHEFLINPEEDFYEDYSSLTEDFLKSYPNFIDVWPEIEQVLTKYPVIVGAADANSVLVLYNALSRYQIDFKPMQFVGARNLCRRGIKSVMYNLPYLFYTQFGKIVQESDAREVASAWTLLVRLALDKAEQTNIPSFCSENRIKLGKISVGEYEKTHTIKDYRNCNRRKIEDIEVDVQRDENNPFCDMSVVFTGKLEKLTRIEAQKLVLQVGGLVPKGVTKDTDYLVVGEQDLRVVGESGLSGKMKKAQEYHEKGSNIEIIGEKEFLEMIGKK